MPKWNLGLNAKLYRASAAFTANNEAAVTGATLTEITRVRDVTVTLEHQSADVSTRESDWSEMAPTLKDGNIEFDMICKPDDTSYLALRNAFIARSEIGIVALTGLKTEPGNDGPAGNFTVMNLTRGEPLTEGIRYTVTLSPSSYMQFYTVST